MSEHFLQYRRGGYAGRGGSSQGGQPSSSPALSALPQERTLTEGLSATPIETVTKPTSASEAVIAVKQLEYIGSFNWTSASKPTIIVPGCPPLWRDRALPYKVPRDSGVRFVDQTGYHMPAYPLYSLVRAVDIMSEDKGDSFDWSTVDIVTDRNGLRKLLRWLNDDGTAKDFRIDTQLAGRRTVLLNRWEKKTREMPNPQYSTYGFSFERESTYRAPDCEQASGYHRIVKYDLDGLTMVVRFEVDACLPTGTSASASRRQTASTDVDSLSNMLSGLAVASGAGKGPAVDKGASTTELDIIRAGQPVPQSSLIEMTTRSRNNAMNYDWIEQYPQLFLSQTPHHYLAVHNRGKFEDITKRALGDAEMKRTEARLQGSFRKLRAALEAIQNLIVEHGERGRLSLVFRDGALQVFERKSQDSCLPEAMLSRFDGL
ncbi:uncharacterized protein C8Q71DRAFT_715353 [Rhodofomes roseus]|uniref:Geranylgeranyl pyrophosphate synthetase n=1 Tax=Rhodofomes roseus TaxID=34475 RepID=A0ABQ8K3Z6_9APHY|nr:uncharacterized protein C8Q71DRAFT_715353 [Rhodofomes roseus]KAH9831408.1 hypothetical protein C8Q71DRAFT_715353 [Rhodofomes roseus]